MLIYHWTYGVHHDGSPRYVSGGPHHVGSVVTIRLRAGLDAPIERVFLRTTPDGDHRFDEMQPLPSADPVAKWWQVELKLTMPQTAYRFLLKTPEGGWWLSASGMTRHIPADATDFKLLVEYQAPPWVRDQVFYQIFPDRFMDGDPSNNVKTGEYTLYNGKPTTARAWGTLPDRSQGQAEFFGGDLPGILQRLEYLQDLGVSALYLTPIFVSPTSHKYDVVDYRTVDPHFGGNEALIALRQALTERGMRLMLDIVPNHCSAVHPWFLEAQADLHAPTADFFTFHHWPDDYEAWYGVRHMPKLNYQSTRLRELMYAGHDAIMRHWMRPPYSIDAWRIDVANMLGNQGPMQQGHEIVRAMRRAVKAEREDLYLIGEHMWDGSPYLQGDELDATMNYQGFTFPVWRWLCAFDLFSPASRPWADSMPLPTSELAAQWQAFLAAIPWQIATQQFNLLGSHDTPRIMTIAGDDAARVLVAATLLFTFPGIPSVYYGDEIGLPGGEDPDNRRCMIWDESQWTLPDLREWYKWLIQLRRMSPALRWGGFEILYAAGETIAYQREAPEERMIVVARRAYDGLTALPVHQAGIPNGTRMKELRSGAEAVVMNGFLPLHGLPPLGAQLWWAPSPTA